MAHISRKEFHNLFKTKIATKLGSLDKDRIKVRNNIFGVVGVILLVDFILFDKLPIPNSVERLQFLGIMSIALGSVVILRILKKFKSKYKRAAIKPLIELAFPTYKYSESSNYSQSDFNSSDLFNLNANRFHSEDQISGVVQATNFSMSEIVARHKSGSGKNKNVTTVFRGLLIKLDFNKSFNAHTIIRPDFSEKFFGSFIGNKLQSMISGNLKLVKLEDPLFEKYFVVLSESQQESRYILSPALMSRIIKTRARLKTEISLSFYNNNLLIAIHKHKNYFEPSIFKELLSYNELKEIYDILDIIDDIIKELDLNTRIWTKE
jgi:hypothetical protein